MPDSTTYADPGELVVDNYLALFDRVYRARSATASLLSWCVESQEIFLSVRVCCEPRRFVLRPLLKSIRHARKESVSIGGVRALDNHHSRLLSTE